MALARQCQRWDTLPEKGGLFDQPMDLMIQMETALAVHNSLRERQAGIKAAKGGAAEWSRNNKELAEYCYELDRMVAE